jgi:transcription termination/antitermination protein NusG
MNDNTNESVSENAHENANIESPEADGVEETAADAATAEPKAKKTVESKDAPAKLTGSDLKWYTVRTYSGHERKVKEHIDKEIEKAGIQHKITQVYIPYEKFVEVKEGKKINKTKNAFPGYILVEMLLDKQTKPLILDTPSVIGFLGVKDEPIPVRPDEIKRIMDAGQDSEKRAINVKSPFEIGHSVKIIDGPFNSLTGLVQEVNVEKMKVKVLINFFGRSTPTEFDFAQVKPANA